MAMDASSIMYQFICFNEPICLINENEQNNRVHEAVNTPIVTGQLFKFCTNELANTSCITLGT